MSSTPLVLLLLLLLIPMINCMETRRRRSVAPFLGSGAASRESMHIPLDQWHCGSNEYSRKATYELYSSVCPSLTAALNHCCAIHDDCYGQHNGQHNCDRDYCECNRMITRMPTEEARRCLPALEDSCSLLEWRGGSEYLDADYRYPAQRSGNVLVAPKYLPEAEGAFMNLYSQCPFANITLASCATNFDLCTLFQMPDSCANDLCHCMLDTSDADDVHYKTCTPAVEDTCRAVLKHSSELLARKTIINSCAIVAGLVILAAASFGFGLYFMYTRNDGNRRNVGDMEMNSVESARSVNPLLLSVDQSLLVKCI